MPKITFPVEATAHPDVCARDRRSQSRLRGCRGRQEDRGQQGSIIAPPTFPQAMAQFDPEYRLRPKPGQPAVARPGQDSRPASQKRQPRPAACTPNRNTPITGRCGRGDILTPSETKARRQGLGEGEQARRQIDFPRAHHRASRPEGRTRHHRTRRRGYDRTPGRRQEVREAEHGSQRIETQGRRQAHRTRRR